MLLWFCGARLLLFTMAREGQERVLFLPRAEQGVPKQNHACTVIYHICVCLYIRTHSLRHLICHTNARRTQTETLWIPFMLRFKLLDVFERLERIQAFVPH